VACANSRLHIISDPSQSKSPLNPRFWVRTSRCHLHGHLEGGLVDVSAFSLTKAVEGVVLGLPLISHRAHRVHRGSNARARRPVACRRNSDRACRGRGVL